MPNSPYASENTLWAWLPILKLIGVASRAFVFFLVLAKSDIYFGSVELLVFWSYVVLIGIVLGLGATDSLLGASDDFLRIIRKVIGTSCVTLLALIFVIPNLSQPSLILMSGMAFGFNQWILGDLRRYSFFFYELASVLVMLVVWASYLLLLQYETPLLSILTSVMLGVTSCFFCAVKLIRHFSDGAINSIQQSTKKIAVSKITWEAAYASVTRFPFLYLHTQNIPAFLPYVYYFAELISVAFGHLQSMFMSKQMIGNDVSRGRLIRWFVSVFAAVYIMFLVIIILASKIEFQYLSPLLGAFGIDVLSLGLPKPEAHKLPDVLSFILIMAAMQFVAFARYWLNLFDSVFHSGVALSMSVLFGLVMLVGGAIGLITSVSDGVVLFFAVAAVSLCIVRKPGGRFSW